VATKKPKVATKLDELPVKPSPRKRSTRDPSKPWNPALDPNTGKIRKGFSLNPKGSAIGTKARYSNLTAAERKELAEKFGMTPLEFLLSVMADVTEEIHNRLDAAKTATPYMHRKMPIAIEGGDTPIMLYDTAALAKLTDKELTTFSSLMAKLTRGSQKEDGE